MAYRPRAKKTAPQGKPDHEAESVRILSSEAGDIDKFPRSKTHGGQSIRASGNIEVEVKRGLSGKDREARPEHGAVLVGERPDQQIVVTARRIEKQGAGIDGREVTSASMAVRIFGRLRRRSG